MRTFILAISVFIASLCSSFMVSEAQAQVPPDVSSMKIYPQAHPALRGFAEIGMGALIGTATGGTAFITSLMLKPWDLRPAFISGAILYPAGIASGAILGGYLTDTKSGYWEPFVGAYVGALFADITAYFLSEDYPIMSALIVLILPIITTTIAVEYSHARHARDEERAIRNAVTRPRQAAIPFTLGFGF